MSFHKSHLNSAPSFLVEIRPDQSGQFTAQLVGSVDLHATAMTRDEAVELLRALIRERLDWAHSNGSTFHERTP